MRGQKRYSTSERIMNYIENERFNISLDLQGLLPQDVNINNSFTIGYAMALEHILAYARALMKEC